MRESTLLHKTIELACDTDNCKTTYACDANLPASVAQADAHCAGWRHSNGKDACPQQAGKKKAAPETPSPKSPAKT
jgi:hypothetical protein